MSPASSAGFGIGIVAIVVGGIAIALGGLGFLGAAFNDDPSGSTDEGRPILALGLIGGGLVAEAAGVTLVVLNAHTRVRPASVLDPSTTSSSTLFPSEVPHRGTPIPGYPPAASWPLLRFAF